MVDDFASRVHELTRALFAEGELEARTTRGEDGRALPDVWLRHRPSGLEVTESRFATQRENHAVACLELLARLKGDQVR